jgi:hypothetical protein
MTRSLTSAQIPEQRHEALQRANDVRIGRARIKRQLRDGSVSIDRVLLNPPEQLATARLTDLLLAVPKLGPARTARLLRSAQLNPLKTVAQLTDRQRAHLIALLRPADATATESVGAGTPRGSA